MLTLMYITNVPEIALIAEKNGIERIWIDLETLGKEERQKNMDTVKSAHTVADAARIKSVLTKSELLVRVNPWNENSRCEINEVINVGADMVMLPMWKTKSEVTEFIATVRGRAKTCLLLETKEAEAVLNSVLAVKGIDEIHIGLNDLHISYGMNFMFELLADGTVERICKKIKKAGLPYGFGGIARLGEGMLPAENIITEHYRLGSTRAILSRSFCDYKKIKSINEVDRIFTENMKKLRDYEKSISRMDEHDFHANKVQICKSVEGIVYSIRKSKEENDGALYRKIV